MTEHGKINVKKIVAMLRWSKPPLDDGLMRHSGGNLEKGQQINSQDICNTEYRFCMIKTLISLSFSYVVCKCIFLKHKKGAVFFFPTI